MQWQHQQSSPKANTTHQEHETSTCWKQATPVPHKEEKTNKSVFPSRWTAGSALSCTGSPCVCCIQNPELPELTPCPFHTESSFVPSHVAAALCQNPDRGHSRDRRVLGARRAPSFARRPVGPAAAAGTASAAVGGAREVLSPCGLSGLGDSCLIARVIGKGHRKSGNEK